MTSTHPLPRPRTLSRTLFTLLAALAAVLLTSHFLTVPAAAAEQSLRLPVTAISDGSEGSGILLADPVGLKAGTTTTRLDLQLPDGCRLGDGGRITCGDGLGAFTFTAMIATGSGFTEPAVTLTADGATITSSQPAGKGDLLVPIFSPADLDVNDPAAKKMLAELVLGNGTAGAPGTSEAIERPAQVTVPADYIYDPSHPQKSLHDYCTWSPDAWGKADFRGPCAHHDMCIEVDLDLPRPERKERRKVCDSTFLTHLVQNCDYGYYDAGVKRRGCHVIAGHYYVAVAGKTAIS